MNNKVNISKTFIGFLIASFLIWALINLSKEYTSKVSYKVDYQELPQNKLLQENPVKEVSLILKGTGFKLFSAKLFSNKILLKTNKLSHKKGNSFYFLPNAQKNEIQEQLTSGLRIENILQDTIYLKIGSLASKKVPVIANTNLHFHAGYNLDKELEIIPDSITISGVLEEVNKIENLTTKTLELEEITTSFSKEIAIETVKNIRFSTNKVIVKAFVDKFTEGEFEIPLVLENVPFGIDISIFKKKVKLTYKVGLKDFGKVTPSSFKVVCDYKDTKDNDLNYLIPKVVAKSALVSSVKVTPDKIEYLIHK